MEITSFKSLVSLALGLVGTAVTLLPGYFNWLGWPLLIVGIGLLLMAFWELVVHRLQIVFLPQKLQLAPYKMLVPLSVAVKKMYNKLEESGPNIVNVLADRGLTGGNDLRFTHLYDTYLWKINPLYGKREGSDIIKEIDKNDVGNISNISDDCTHVTRTLGQIVYTDLMVEKRHLMNALKEIQGDKARKA